MSHEILVINPGSTSTKIGVFADETLRFDVTLRHSAEELAPYATIADQKEFRKNLVLSALREKNYDAKSLSAVSARGGLVAPIPGGTYAVNERLLADCAAGVQGQHASNLGAMIAHEIGEELAAIPLKVIDEGTGKSVDNPIFTQSGSGFPMNSNPSGPEMMARPFRNVDQKHLLMPIPELEMSVNKAIDTNNPGWN